MTPVADRTFTTSAPFECRWQCTECGFQITAPPVEATGDSYRAPAEPGPIDRRPQGSCAGCGQHGTWANLREGAVVEALIVQDETRQANRGSRRSGLIKLIALSIWLTVVAFAVYGHGGWYLFPIALGTTWMMAHTALVEYRAEQQARFATSWTHELPPKGRVRSRHVGALAGPEGLRAPLSDRPCLAYEIGVRHDSDAQAEPGTWTLLEQRSVAGLRVGDVAVERGPYLCVERELYIHELSPRARDELRKRGIDPTRPGYTLFETVIAAGEDVELRRHRRGLALAPAAAR